MCSFFIFLCLDSGTFLFVLCFQDPTCYLSCDNEFENCAMIAHLECMADFVLEQSNPSPTPGQRASTESGVPMELLPTIGVCQMCHCDMSWSSMIRAMATRKQVLQDVVQVLSDKESSEYDS